MQPGSGSWPLIARILIVFIFAGPAAAHDWYAGLRIPGTKVSCCNDKDCRPVEHRYGPGGSDEIFVGGQWRPIDRRALLDNASPDGLWHACGGPLPRCVIQAGGAV